MSLRRSAASSGNAARQGVRPSIHVSDGHPTVDGSSESLPSIDRESPLVMLHRTPYFVQVATALQNSSNEVLGSANAREMLGNPQNFPDRHGFWGGVRPLTTSDRTAMIHVAWKEVDHGRTVGDQIAEASAYTLSAQR